MTSGNVSGDPIAIGNQEALDRLGGIADGFLLHDREIVARYDDSVVRVAHGEPLFLRRARGHAPLPLTLPVASPMPLLAVGADLKNTFTLVEGRRAYVSQHIGDLEQYETAGHFAEALRRFQELFQIVPRRVVRDRHPGYHSTRIAGDLGLPQMVVQHHHAHIAAVLAEHGETGPALGISYDGTGFGDDDQVWGAEILDADLVGYRRMASLRHVPMPGGDLAARLPWRAALGWLSLEPAHREAFALAFDGVRPVERAVATAQIVRRLNTPLASSMGRLFDAAAAIIGVRRVSEYEGQAAMELESLAGDRPGREHPVTCRPGPDGVVAIDALPLLAELGRARQRGTAAADLAADFHESVAGFTARAALDACRASGRDTVVLGGGVFQNVRLATGIPDRLRAHGLRVLLPRVLSPNDGSISYGQAAIAAARLAAGHEEAIPCA
jgi:hydrogenase maturation protein HypF